MVLAPGAGNLTFDETFHEEKVRNVTYVGGWIGAPGETGCVPARTTRVGRAGRVEQNARPPGKSHPRLSSRRADPLHTGRASYELYEGPMGYTPTRGLACTHVQRK